MPPRRTSVPCEPCVCVFLLGLDLGQDVALAQDQQVLAVDLDLGAAVLGVEDGVARGDVERDALLAVIVVTTVADSETSPFCGFSLAVSGRTMPLAVVSSSSIARTINRSPRGLSFMYIDLRREGLGIARWHSGTASANARFILQSPGTPARTPWHSGTRSARRVGHIVHPPSDGRAGCAAGRCAPHAVRAPARRSRRRRARCAPHDLGALDAVVRAGLGQARRREGDARRVDRLRRHRRAAGRGGGARPGRGRGCCGRPRRHRGRGARDRRGGRGGAGPRRPQARRPAGP